MATTSLASVPEVTAMPIAELAARANPASLQTGELRLAPALHSAVLRATTGHDVQGAVDELAGVLSGDAASAEAVLRGILTTLAGSERRELAPVAKAGLLSALAAHPDSAEVLDVLGTLPGGRDAEVKVAVCKAIASLPHPERTAFALADRVNPLSYLRLPLLGISAEEKSLEIPSLERLPDLIYGHFAAAAVLHRLAKLLAKTAPERLSEVEPRWIEELLAAGLSRRVLDAFAAARPESRQALLEGRMEGRHHPYRISLPIPDLRPDLAAAAILEGDAERARAFLEAIPERRRRGPPGRADEATREATLWQLFDHSLGSSTRDPFDLLITSMGISFESPAANVGLWRTARRAVARVAEREGYLTLAAAMRQGIQRDLGYERWSVMVASAEFCDHHALPAVYKEAKVLFAELEEALAADARSVPAGNASSAALARRIGQPVPIPYELKKLPAGVEVGSLGAAAIPQGMTLPEGFSAVRVERARDQEVAIGFTETPGPRQAVAQRGYWIVRSTDGGATWSWLYTGLRSQRPYRAVEISGLPLASEDGVQIEVVELDPKSAAAPPVATGLVLDLPWRELERDTDGDGLSDLYEAGILSDPRSADTDADGVADGQDPLPGVPFAPILEAATAPLAALLAATSGEPKIAFLPACAEVRCHGRADLRREPRVFVVADRRPWAALVPPWRVVLLTTDELAATSDRLGFRPATHLVFEVDHASERAIASWHQNLSVGFVRLRKAALGWTVESSLSGIR